ncbi:hypothetical protein [Pannonibacter tanglangensis]|uniref:Uncharacterized protein n=1 Tax=Pannonibacter tanglangensis TaxID=2750084 RepID=A0ABW9ZHF2_9HYPH|nr:hypothetical protein [Pannonibacter sp. XCT-34]NBN63463.1 hypothetical protein [Pannonibacter sp. XCT-34]
MELELDVICTELDGLLADFLERWARDLGHDQDPADIERLYCMYPRVVTQIASARASLGGADHTMRLARNLRFDPAPELGLRAVPGAGGCGHPCGSGVSGVYVVQAEAGSVPVRRGARREADREGPRGADRGECRCHDRDTDAAPARDDRGNDRANDRASDRGSDRASDPVSTGSGREEVRDSRCDGSRGQVREDDRNPEEDRDVRNADRFRA